jgi:SAM-dependent methyltransferase
MHEAIIDKIVTKYGRLMGENDLAFLKRVYSTPSETYARRLNAVGFSGRMKVLDAGCGFGQWSIELAKLNGYLYAIDAQPHRLFILNEVVDWMGIDNVEIQWGRLERLSYPDEMFDAVFCYGVIFCTDWKKSLAEFARVLKEDGLLYLTANGLGWYLNLWENRPRQTADYDPRENAAQSFWNTIEYEKFNRPPRKGQIIIEPEQMVEAVERCGLTVIGQGGEGTIRLSPGTPPPEPFFQDNYENQTGCYEILARK